MSRVFAYCRVSTAEQSYENQILEIQAAGFSLEQRRVIAETVSGSTPAMERKGFRKLVDRLDWEDVLVVTKLDRLGRKRDGRPRHGRATRRDASARPLSGAGRR